MFYQTTLSTESIYKDVCTRLWKSLPLVFTAYDWLRGMSLNPFGKITWGKDEKKGRQSETQDDQQRFLGPLHTTEGELARSSLAFITSSLLVTSGRVRGSQLPVFPKSAEQQRGALTSLCFLPDQRQGHTFSPHRAARQSSSQVKRHASIPCLISASC